MLNVGELVVLVFVAGVLGVPVLVQARLQSELLGAGRPLSLGSIDARSSTALESRKLTFVTRVFTAPLMEKKRNQATYCLGTLAHDGLLESKRTTKGLWLGLRGVDCGRARRE